MVVLDMSKDFLSGFSLPKSKSDRDLQALYMDLSTDDLYRLHEMINDRLNWINGEENNGI